MRNPDEDYHLAFQIDRLLDRVERGDDLNQDVQLELDEMEGDYLLPDIVTNLTDWYQNSEFQAAIDGLDELEDGISQAEQQDWTGVGAEYHYHRIKLRSDLGGHNAENEINDAFAFLESHYEAISTNLVTPIIEITIDNIDDLSTSSQDDWLELIENLSQQARSENQFSQQRTYLHLLRQFCIACSKPTSDVELELIDSYRAEADLLGRRSAMRKADILESGIAACTPYMSTTERTQWKREALEARRQGIQTEMTEISVEELPGVNPDALAEEMQRNTEIIVEWFKATKSNFGSAAYALYCLFHSPSIVPDVHKIRLNTEEFVLSRLLHRQVISPEAYTLSIDPADIESIPNNYGQEAVSMMSSLGNALSQLIEGDHIKISDIFELIWISDSLNPSTEAFLTDGLIELFDNNYPAALFLLMPQLEATIVDTLESVGRPPYTVLSNETRQQLLGGLFIEGSDLFGDHLAVYLRYRYTSREGLNLRNRLSHGQLRYPNANYLNAILTVLDIVRCMVKINSGRFLGQFNVPQRSLTPGTHFGSSTDLSLFTDLNAQIIGYGRSDDDHCIVVLRQVHHEDYTEFFVSRSMIDRFQIDGIGHSRGELLDAIDDLRENHSVIPDNIDWTWLDTDDLILHTLRDVIDDELDTPASTIAREHLFKLAQERGIDESTARFYLSELEDRDEIVETERQGHTEILRSIEPLQIVESAITVEGIGQERAWDIVDHFDSYESFSRADADQFQAITGIGPEFASRLASN